jgi:hypothetical protein
MRRRTAKRNAYDSFLTYGVCPACGARGHPIAPVGEGGRLTNVEACASSSRLRRLLAGLRVPRPGTGGEDGRIVGHLVDWARIPVPRRAVSTLSGGVSQRGQAGAPARLRPVRLCTPGRAERGAAQSDARPHRETSKRLRDAGNTVLVVEPTSTDGERIGSWRSGPRRGRRGESSSTPGRPPDRSSAGYAEALRARAEAEAGESGSRRRSGRGLPGRNACLNNLKNVSVDIPGLLVGSAAPPVRASRRPARGLRSGHPEAVVVTQGSLGRTSRGPRQLSASSIHPQGIRGDGADAPLQLNSKGAARSEGRRFIAVDEKFLDGHPHGCGECPAPLRPEGCPPVKGKK